MIQLDATTVALVAAGIGVVGAILGAAAATLGTVWVNRREADRARLVRIYEVLVPQMRRALWEVIDRYADVTSVISDPRINAEADARMDELHRAVMLLGDRHYEQYEPAFLVPWQTTQTEIVRGYEATQLGPSPEVYARVAADQRRMLMDLAGGLSNFAEHIENSLVHTWRGRLGSSFRWRWRRLDEWWLALRSRLRRSDSPADADAIGIEGVATTNSGPDDDAFDDGRHE